MDEGGYIGSSVKGDQVCHNYLGLILRIVVSSQRSDSLKFRERGGDTFKMSSCLLCSIVVT